jgi:hypothetical protein
MLLRGLRIFHRSSAFTIRGASPLITSRFLYATTTPPKINLKENERFIPAEINPIGSTNARLRNALQRQHFVRVDKVLGNLAVVSRRSVTEFMAKNKICVVIGYIEQLNPTGEPTRIEKLQSVKYSNLVYPPAVRVNGKPLDYVHT